MLVALLQPWCRKGLKVQECELQTEKVEFPHPNPLVLFVCCRSAFSATTRQPTRTAAPASSAQRTSAPPPSTLPVPRSPEWSWRRPTGRTWCRSPAISITKGPSQRWETREFAWCGLFSWTPECTGVSSACQLSKFTLIDNKTEKRGGRKGFF